MTRGVLRTVGLSSILLGLVLATGCSCSRSKSRPSATLGAPQGARGAAVPATATPPAAEGAPKRLVVAVVVDQFAAWLADERWPLLPIDGGFARLRREGTWYRQMRLAHACTETAPGHAALFTGRVPRENGIVANELLDAKGEPVYVMLDAQAHVVSDGGVLPAVGSSLRALVGETLADRLRARQPDAFIAALSGKDRGAMFAAGHHPDVAAWYDTNVGGFVTSTIYAQTLWPEVANVAGATALKPRLDWVWTPLDPAFLRAHSLTPDEAPGEADPFGLGRAFPHALSHSTGAAAALRSTPLVDELVLSTALSVLSRGKDRSVGFLALSLSANDAIGHPWGPDSWEAWDNLLRLDHELAEVMRQLDRRLGPEHWSLVLSADHGVAPLPEVDARRRKGCPAAAESPVPCRSQHRAPWAEVERRLREAAEQAVGDAEVLGKLLPPNLYLSEKGLALDGEGRQKLSRALQQVADGKLLEHVYAAAEFPASCPPLTDQSLSAVVCRSTRPGVSGDYYLVPAPTVLLESSTNAGAGTNHGSPWLWDRTVPLLVRAPGRAPVHAEHPEPVPFTRYAELLEALLVSGRGGVGPAR